MIFNFKNLLATISFVAISSAASAMVDREGVDPEGNLHLTIRTLKNLYEGNQVTLQDKSFGLFKYPFETFQSVPRWEMFNDDKVIRGFRYNGYGGDEYRFHESDGGMPPLPEWDPETNSYKKDEHGNIIYTEAAFPEELFNLTVVPFLMNEKPLHNLNVSISPQPIDNVPFISLPPKEEEPIISIEQEKPTITIVKEKPFIDSPNQDFYIEYDPKNNLYFGIEKLSNPEINSFWRHRIGYERDFFCRKTINREKQNVNNMSQEEKESIIKANSEFNNNISFFYGGSIVNDESLYSQTLRDVENLPSAPFDPEFEVFVSEKGPEELPSYGQAYIDAWKAFTQNLDNYSKYSWVAYVSSQPVDEPLYLKTSPFSPDVLMAMTFNISDHFYSPMGIFGSPISKISGSFHKNSSMSLQGAVARLVDNINPNIEYVSFRPLKKMGEILKESGVSFSSSDGTYIINPEYPHTLNEEGGFQLYDPRTQTSYAMNEQHWFSQHPFSGGGNPQKIKEHPFITVDHNLLKDF